MNSSYKMSEIYELVELSKQGDTRALEELLRRIQKDVFAMFSYLASERQDVADLTQEALIKTAKTLPYLRESGSFKSWLNHIITNNKKIRQLRDYFITQIQKNIDLCYLNGHNIQRLPNNVNISFGMVDGESVMMLLDLQGIAVSTGSACSVGSIKQSPVLKAMGLSSDLVSGAVRFTLSKSTTKKELDIVVEQLVKIVQKLRHISPIGKGQVGTL